MLKITPYKTKEKFVRLNQEFILENYTIFYQHIHSLFLSEANEVYHIYKIADENGNHAYCMWYFSNYIIVSKKWDEELFNSLNKCIELHKFTTFGFTGPKDLILKLFEENSIKYELFKDRIIFECSEVDDSIRKIGEFECANLNDIKTISNIHLELHRIEYGKSAYKTLNQIHDAVEKSIAENNIYKIVVNGKIHSVAQVLSRQQGNPIIGSFYTYSQFRNLGYGTYLLSELTKLLLNEGHSKCGLLGERINLSALTVFKKVGYIAKYDQIAVFKKV